MFRIFGGPHRYIQGPGALSQLGAVTAPFGRQPIIIADAFILELIGPQLGTIMQSVGLEPAIRAFGGEITYPAIDALRESLDERSGGIVVGIGGGKTLDAAKALAHQLGIPTITVPTIASNDSPTSASMAMYDDNHVMIAVDRMARSPEAVIVDTKLIAAAPARFLRAGIGDAISKKFEADGCLAGTGITPFGTRPLLTAIAIGDACYNTLRQHAAIALESVERNEVNDAVEATVEATLLMSGLAFENGGLSLTHSLTRGLVKARDAKNAIHGEHIAWGLLVQLVVEQRPTGEIADVLHFLRSIGLPVNLGGLGMKNPTQDEITDIAHWTMTAPHLKNLAQPVDTQSIAKAIASIEELSSRLN